MGWGGYGGGAVAGLAHVVGEGAGNVVLVADGAEGFAAEVVVEEDEGDARVKIIEILEGASGGVAGAGVEGDAYGRGFAEAQQLFCADRHVRGERAAVGQKKLEVVRPALRGEGTDGFEGVRFILSRVAEMTDADHQLPGGESFGDGDGWGDVFINAAAGIIDCDGRGLRHHAQHEFRHVRGRADEGQTAGGNLPGGVVLIGVEAVEQEGDGACAAPRLKGCVRCRMALFRQDDDVPRVLVLLQKSAGLDGHTVF